MGRNVIMHVSHTQTISPYTVVWVVPSHSVFVTSDLVCDKVYIVEQLVLWPGCTQQPAVTCRRYPQHRCTHSSTSGLSCSLENAGQQRDRETERETSPPIRISAVEGQCKLSPIPTRWSQHCSPEHLPSSQSPAIAQTNPSTTRTLIQVELSQTSRGGIVN